MSDQNSYLSQYYPTSSEDMRDPRLHPDRDSLEMLPRLPDRRPELRNAAPRPQDPLTPAYEGASPAVSGYGMGQTAGQGWNALRDGRYSDATLNAVELLAGLIVPGPSGKALRGKVHEPGAAAGTRFGAGAEAGGLPNRGGLEGGNRWLPASGGAEHPYTPPVNQPATVKIPGYGEVEARPIPQIEAARKAYMESKGEQFWTPKELEKLDPDRAKRIAEAFDVMEHNPHDPQVRKAYDAMIQETLDQYKYLDNQGIKFTFNEGGVDPYAASPAMGYPELRDKGTLSIFPTVEGYGSGVGLTREQVAQNPLLGDSGIKFGDRPALYNDLFRAVHDAYGHFGPGNPFFRPKGEERAWQHHSTMFGPEGLKALTTETRGQNSWLGFGPFAEHNATAKGADTIFADQKVGLLPEFAWTEGRPQKPETP